MRKQEFIHLHGLLAEVAKYAHEEDVPLDLSAYKELETRSTSIHHAKGAHKDAVLALAGALATGMEEDIEREATTVSAISQ